MLGHGLPTKSYYTISIASYSMIGAATPLFVGLSQINFHAKHFMYRAMHMLYRDIQTAHHGTQKFSIQTADYSSLTLF